MRIVGQHQRHRLADKADLVQRQHRLIVKGRAIIRIRNERKHVLAGDDAVHPGSALAALVSIRRMRPCATVLRNTFTCSIPGSFTF